jgi:hypothetical protein
VTEQHVPDRSARALRGRWLEESEQIADRVVLMPAVPQVQLVMDQVAIPVADGDLREVPGFLQIADDRADAPPDTEHVGMFVTTAMDEVLLAKLTS